MNSCECKSIGLDKHTLGCPVGDWLAAEYWVTFNAAVQGRSSAMYSGKMYGPSAEAVVEFAREVANLAHNVKSAGDVEVADNPKK